MFSVCSCTARAYTEREKVVQKKDSDLHLAPPTNRGVVSAYKSSELSEIMLVDWLQVSVYSNDSKIKSNDVKFVAQLFKYLFNIEFSEVLINERSPHFGYTDCYSYRNILIFQHSINEDMGTHIYLTGTGCRDLESLNISYLDFFEKCSHLNAHYSRIDISFDLFHNKFFTLNKIYNCINNLEVVTKFRNSIQFIKDNLITKDNIGHTIWFGSRTSDIQFVFYDKLKERIYNANCEIDNNIKYWYRLEIRFRNEKAMNVVYNYLFNSDFNLYIKSVINNYISFRVYNKNQKQRCRWQNKTWWNNFLNTTNKIRFQYRPIEYDITKKKDWLDRVASRSTLAVILSDIEDISLDNITLDYIVHTLKIGLNKIEQIDIEKINQYRILNKLSPLTLDDINSYITDIKDIIIQRT